MALTVEQEIERRQKIDIARAKQLHERTPEEQILVQTADLADATAKAQAAEIAANQRQFQYETQTFLMRNPNYKDHGANVSAMRSQLAKIGGGWNARDLESAFRNAPEGTFDTVVARPIINPDLEPPAAVTKTYDLSPEALSRIKPQEMTEIRRRDPERYAKITEALSDLIARVGGGLARKIMNGQELNETDKITLSKAYGS